MFSLKRRERESKRENRIKVFRFPAKQVASGMQVETILNFTETKLFFRNQERQIL